jgi:hypothetical protein
MSLPILYLPPEHPLHKLPDPLREKLASAQRNLIQLEFPTAGAICARVFDELRMRVVTPADLVDQPVGAVVDLPFQKLSQLMLGILQRADVPEASVDSLSKTIAQRIQLLRAFPNPDKTLVVPREARDVGIGVTPLETRHCYPVGASA